jgi:hypothetical protein
MSSGSQRWLLSLILVLGIGGEAAAEVNLECATEAFVWREFDENGRILKESGPRFRFGAQWQHAFDVAQRNLLYVRGALYLGRVDYDGQAQNISTGERSPFQTDAYYVGAIAEAMYARRFGPLSASGEVFVGGGIDNWRRDVEGRDGVAGAIEDWTVFYVLAGGGGHWQSVTKRYHAQAGFKYPFYTHEVPGAFDVVLEPKGRLSFFARVSTDFITAGRARWGLGLYYDSYRFDQSDTERAGRLLIWQPESHQDTLGFFGTYYF